MVWRLFSSALLVLFRPRSRCLRPARKRAPFQLALDDDCRAEASRSLAAPVGARSAALRRVRREGRRFDRGGRSGDRGVDLREEPRRARDHRLGHEADLDGGRDSLPGARRTSSSTTFWRRGEIRDGEPPRSLLVVGGGDPNISGRFYDDDTFAIFDKWADGLAAGRHPAGRRGSDPERELFDEEYRHPDWPPERDSRWYQAPIPPSPTTTTSSSCRSAAGAPGLAGRACRSIRTPTSFRSLQPRTDCRAPRRPVKVAVSRAAGSDLVTVSGTVPRRYFRWSTPLSIDDPPKFFGAALKSRLKAAGIELTGRRRRAAGPGRQRLDPRRDDRVRPAFPTLAIANKRSQSFYAEQIFKTLAYEKTGAGDVGRAH